MYYYARKKSGQRQEMRVFMTKLSREQLCGFANEAFSLNGTSGEVGAATGKFRFVLKLSSGSTNIPGSALIEAGKITTTPAHARLLEMKLKKFKVGYEIKTDVISSKGDEK